MAVSQQSNSCQKAACSVSEMAGRCELSRARFYELIKAGVMPPPCYDLQTPRPLYPLEIQQICLDVRRTNTAISGKYVLFNNKRTDGSQQTSRAPKPPAPPAQKLEAVAGLVEGLRALGVGASEKQIEASLTACYPGAIVDPVETIIRSVFRHLRRAGNV